MLTDQVNLLGESLALLDELQPAGVSLEPWWGDTARMQLQDELFRYFIALPHYASKAHYTDAPRIALEACLSPAAAFSQPPREKQVIPLARPVALTEVESARGVLRQLVAFPAVKGALLDSFGTALVDTPLGAGAASRDRLAKMVVDLFRRGLVMAGPVRRAVPSEVSGGREFVLHLKVADQIERLLGQTLPFGTWGVRPPKRIEDFFALLDRLDSRLIDGLRPAGELRQDPVSFTIAIWGLALSVTARVYLADFLCCLTRVALPLGRLYEETRNGSKTVLSLDSGGRGGVPVLTKTAYNAYTAVGLVELLTDQPMPHIERAGGYLANRRSLKELGALRPFDSFWSGTDAVLHASIVRSLNTFLGAPVLRFQYSTGRDEKQIVVSERLTIEGLQRLMLRHAVPTVTPPTAAPRKTTTTRKSTVDHSALKACGRYVTHLRLAVARRLALILSSQIRPLHEALPKAAGSYIRMGSGSLLWGGNHLPHFEHRDGLTFDIGVPHSYLRWATGTLQSDAKSGKSKTVERRPKSQVLGVPEPPYSEQSYHILGEPPAVFADPGFKSAYPALIDHMWAGTVIPKELDDFAGTPILLGDDGDADDELLLPNLIGHVALALAGVRKWIYASYYEHFFAIRAVGALFRSTDWQTALPQETKAMAALIRQAAFIWAPLDHHDHWHVVFDRAQGGSSLGPDPFTLDVEALARQLKIWVALGVDPAPFARELAGRRVLDAHLFEPITRERQMILDLLRPYVEEKVSASELEERKARGDAFTKVLAEAIGKTSYQEIPSLKDTHYKDWVRGSGLSDRHPAPPGTPPKQWKRWDSDMVDPQMLPESPPAEDGAD